MLPIGWLRFRILLLIMPLNLAIAAIMIGPFNDTTYVMQTLQLSRDDMLFLYTDGVPEAMSATDMSGEPRLVEVLRAHPGREVASIVATVHSAVERRGSAAG